AGLRAGCRPYGAADYRAQDGSGDDHDAHDAFRNPPASRGAPRRGSRDMSAPEVSGQEWSARRYAETAHFVPALGASVLGLLAPSAGERILDLGCGDGVLTGGISAAGAAGVAGGAAPGMAGTRRD